MREPLDADATAHLILRQEQPLVLFDTNVILDALLDRQPWAAYATALFNEVRQATIHGVVAGHAVTTVYYVHARHHTASRARERILWVLEQLRVAPVGYSELHRAAVGDFSDFEDGVTHEAAVAFDCHGIVTRNEADFAAARLPITTPAALVRAFASH